MFDISWAHMDQMSKNHRKLGVENSVWRASLPFTSLNKTFGWHQNRLLHQAINDCGLRRFDYFFVHLNTRYTFVHKLRAHFSSRMFLLQVTMLILTWTIDAETRWMAFFQYFYRELFVGAASHSNQRPVQCSFTLLFCPFLSRFLSHVNFLP